MLASDFELRGFDSRDWLRLVDLFPHPLAHSSGPKAPASSGDEADASGGLIAMGRRDELLRLWRAGAGPLSTEGHPWPMSSEELAAKHQAPWVAKLHPGALLELQERFGSRLRPQDSLQDQWVKLLVAVQELVNEDGISLWPRRLFNWPALVRENLARSAFELLCPPGKCLLLGVFEAGELFTALALRRGEEEIDLVLGPGELRQQMGLLSGDWFRDYAHLVSAVETHLSPVAGGCFAEAVTLRRLLAERKPGSFSQAVAARDLVLHPVNPAFAVSLGVDVGRAALAGVQSLTQRIASYPLAQHPAVQKVKSVAKRDSNIEDLLGFDPIAAIGRLIIDPKDDR